MSNVRMQIMFVMACAAAGCGDDGDNDFDQTTGSAKADGGAEDGGADAQAPPADGGGDASIADAGLEAGAPADAAVDAAVDAASPKDAAPEDAAIDDGSATSATFTEVYALISDNCSPCHTEGSSGSLDMSSQANAYDSLVDQAAAGPACGDSNLVRAVPGDAEASLIIQKLEGTADCGARMPRNRAPLSEEQIAVFRSWIDAGANDD
jgi:hypothetical protein